MAGTRDLLEAQAFERRRLAAAFVTGEGEAAAAPRPSRYVLVGLVLAALMVAGAAILGRL